MRIGFIGTGAMVSAILRGAVRAGADASTFVLTDRHFSAAVALAEEIGATPARSNAALASQVDMVVLGVKPHIQREVIADIASTVKERNVAVASIAAGRTIDAIISDFGAAVPVIRVMPNVNAQIGLSMSAICSDAASREQIDAVTTLMGFVGRTIALDEKDFPAFQALASCSPAWTFQIIDTLARAGVKHGLSKSASTTIAAQALAGSAQLCLHGLESGTQPAQLIDQVTSPGGTTIAGLLAAEEAGLNTALIRAVDAAIARDAELA